MQFEHRTRTADLNIGPQFRLGKRIITGLTGGLGDDARPGWLLGIGR